MTATVVLPVPPFPLAIVIFKPVRSIMMPSPWSTRTAGRAVQSRESRVCAGPLCRNSGTGIHLRDQDPGRPSCLFPCPADRHRGCTRALTHTALSCHRSFPSGPVPSFPGIMCTSLVCYQCPSTSAPASLLSFPPLCASSAWRTVIPETVNTSTPAPETTRKALGRGGRL